MAKALWLIFLVASHFLVSAVMSSRSFTIENKCEETIWPASYDYSGSLDTTGMVLEKGETRTINASSPWIGRFWGRSRCITNTTGAFLCASGDCSSGDIECLGNATQPMTVAEFNLAPDGGLDYYDVSVIDGYNFLCL